MAIVIRSSGLLVLLVPGTASTSIERALQRAGYAELLDPRHGTVPELRDNRADLSGVSHVACLVRNHYDMLHAEWFRSRTRWILEINDPKSVGGWPLDKRMEIAQACALDFSGYIEWMFGKTRREGRTSEMYSHFTRDCTNVFQIEQIDKFTEWLAGHGVAIDIPRENQSPGRPEYWRDYSAKARATVAAVFGEEIARYGYAF